MRVELYESGIGPGAIPLASSKCEGLRLELSDGTVWRITEKDGVLDLMNVGAPVRVMPGTFTTANDNLVVSNRIRVEQI